MSPRQGQPDDPSAGAGTTESPAAAEPLELLTFDRVNISRVSLVRAARVPNGRLLPPLSLTRCCSAIDSDENFVDSPDDSDELICNVTRVALGVPLLTPDDKLSGPFDIVSLLAPPLFAALVRCGLLLTVDGNSTSSVISQKQRWASSPTDPSRYDVTGSSLVLSGNDGDEDGGGWVLTWFSDNRVSLESRT